MDYYVQHWVLSSFGSRSEVILIIRIRNISLTLFLRGRMVGQVLGAVGHLPSIYTELEVSYYLLRRLLGVRTEGNLLMSIMCVYCLNSIWNKINLKFGGRWKTWFQQIVLLQPRNCSGDKKGAKVAKLTKNEVLMVNIGSLSTGGRVIAVKADLAKIGLTTPVCTEVGEKIALSRR